MPQMAKQHRRDQQGSITYNGGGPLEGATFELGELVQENSNRNLTKDQKNRLDRVSHSKPPSILTTPRLISAACHVLDYTGRSLSFLHHKDNSNGKVNSPQRYDLVDTFELEKDYCKYGLWNSESLNPSSLNHLPSVAQKNFDFLRALYGALALKSTKQSYNQLLLQRFQATGKSLPLEYWEDRGLSILGISYGLGNMYKWMSRVFPAGGEYTSNHAVSEGHGAANYFSDIKDHHSRDYKLVEGSRAKCMDRSSPSQAQTKGFASDLNKESGINTRHGASFESDYCLLTDKNLEADPAVSENSKTNIYPDHYVHALAFRSTDKKSWNYGRTEMFDDRKAKFDDDVAEEDSKREICLPTCANREIGMVKREHAFAGAFAGICVSLCLHPIDTIKTVLQSCRAEEKSVLYIGRSIVSERGLTGLYRGISSNIASSAPVSAVYTFTYESVKGALLPLFPKEYYSVAHCIAGGCASVATSFIFTPSERIKQQLQVGSHYHNCWDAMVGIIRNGGLPSLYTGWGAVLCRNIPHSVIKFYTYESLKQWMLSSGQPIGQLTTLQTLICGGLAGSTAAFFTTPFDVVKTRLQTQKPGSVGQYYGVFHTLREISKHEGLTGLYRGLTPRLVMYITQGALFFASYEFFKAMFNLNEPQLKPCIKEVEHEESKEYQVKPLDIELSSPSSSAAVASSLHEGINVVNTPS